jgi:rubredoxin
MSHNEEVELMNRQMSRAQREAAFLERAAQMYAVLEDWYDQHPEASFGEIEAEARRLRHKLMGEGLAVLINGRDTGYQLEAPRCSVCGQAMEFKGHRRWGISGLEGETTLIRAYYVCPECKGETLFPPGSEAAVTS